MFLVTKSDHYYPEAGTGDWVGVRGNLSDAMALFREVKASTQAGAGCSVFLIRITRSGWSTIDRVNF